MTARYHAYYESPIGLVEVGGTAEHVTSLHFVDARRAGARAHPLVREACRQVRAYFEGEVRRFDLPLSPTGAPFQVRVWRALLEIPYGQAVSYGALARAVGNPRASRAVGAANARNPIALVAPCHRVVGADGRLTGYGGGLWRKEWLLLHEGCKLRGRRVVPAPGLRWGDWIA
ncbi:MAG: methylated-DNA--[protein]-cysteine S-methyltransferase [Deltaproteobacteria bacterium]|nr:methylated-DNA--[protein]-cysteine S-methyltransferase [Deltaproteobacteria bacterium]MBW1922942.1 methylated-DNA--[protein]-cysteine S-methyltransferase [Deltaproteobacteria bacterium]MBW1950689.1 methylated-DNA--[protein]-cysteine S-methyltransferase [Deltaproteobacteria bacterium]MBW2008539.1 methylated-DNA--[protein]-cysteine S-methyltransferase [Deltaproteobacteria bacterium]MBW2101611.1 methylated-DNA--[protein]-cysteine S-methyltransferase [Deltaproteobacteria bacterium]